MLLKSQRLTTELFGNIIEKGQSFHCPFLILRVIKVGNNKERSRFAVSVPKKVAKTAVLRNKIKRRVYSIVKSYEFKIKSDLHAIFIAKTGTEKLSFTDLKMEIEKIFVKSGILK